MTFSSTTMHWFIPVIYGILTAQVTGSANRFLHPSTGILTHTGYVCYGLYYNLNIFIVMKYSTYCFVCRHSVARSSCLFRTW
jgi:hypothetical protein